MTMWLARDIKACFRLSVSGMQRMRDNQDPSSPTGKNGMVFNETGAVFLPVSIPLKISITTTSSKCCSSNQGRGMRVGMRSVNKDNPVECQLQNAAELVQGSAIVQRQKCPRERIF